MSDNTPHKVFWAVVRNQTTRHTYIEIGELGKNKWSVVLDGKEFTIKSTSTDFFELLRIALEKYAA